MWGGSPLKRTAFSSAARAWHCFCVPHGEKLLLQRALGGDVAKVGLRTETGTLFADIVAEEGGRRQGGGLLKRKKAGLGLAVEAAMREQSGLVTVSKHLKKFVIFIIK